MEDPHGERLDRLGLRAGPLEQFVVAAGEPDLRLGPDVGFELLREHRHALVLNVPERVPVAKQLLHAGDQRDD